MGAGRGFGLIDFCHSGFTGAEETTGTSSSSLLLLSSVESSSSTSSTVAENLRGGGGAAVGLLYDHCADGCAWLVGLVFGGDVDGTLSLALSLQL